MRSSKKPQSYASKLTRSDGKKTGGEKKVPVDEVEADGVSVEQLMQQQEGPEMESSITTVDEVVKGPVVPQPGVPGGSGCPPFRFQQPAEAQPQVLMYPGGQTGGQTVVEQFSQQQQQQQPQQPPPLHIYSPGSPPLPLAGPLHLVYLQPSPHGINVIPFQAVGCPTFTPNSPLGFPAHPNHPVVVQSPQMPPTFPHHQYQHHELPPGYHPANQAFLNQSQPPPQGFYPGPGPGPVSPRPVEKKIFRPWEDAETNDVQAGLSNLKIN